MPSYYSPYALYPASYPVMNQPAYISSQAPSPSYMVSVDGEIGARAWQMPANLPPNSVIPLWDLDGKHVYFKSTDGYGRLNPMRKGVIVFEDDAVTQKSGDVREEQPLLDMSNYVTKDDLATLRQDIRSMIMQARNSSSRNNENRGESR